MHQSEPRWTERRVTQPPHHAAQAAACRLFMCDMRDGISCVEEDNKVQASSTRAHKPWAPVLNLSSRRARRSVLNCAPNHLQQANAGYAVCQWLLTA